MSRDPGIVSDDPPHASNVDPIPSNLNLNEPRIAAPRGKVARAAAAARRARDAGGARWEPGAGYRASPQRDRAIADLRAWKLAADCDEIPRVADDGTIEDCTSGSEILAARDAGRAFPFYAPELDALDVYLTRTQRAILQWVIAATAVRGKTWLLARYVDVAGLALCDRDTAGVALRKLVREQLLIAAPLFTETIVETRTGKVAKLHYRDPNAYRLSGRVRQLLGLEPDAVMRRQALSLLGVGSSLAPMISPDCGGTPVATPEPENPTPTEKHPDTSCSLSGGGDHHAPHPVDTAPTPTLASRAALPRAERAPVLDVREAAATPLPDASTDEAHVFDRCWSDALHGSRGRVPEQPSTDDFDAASSSSKRAFETTVEVQPVPRGKLLRELARIRGIRGVEMTAAVDRAYAADRRALEEAAAGARQAKIAFDHAANEQRASTRARPIAQPPSGERPEWVLDGQRPVYANGELVAVDMGDGRWLDPPTARFENRTAAGARACPGRDDFADDPREIEQLRDDLVDLDWLIGAGAGAGGEEGGGS